MGEMIASNLLENYRIADVKSSTDPPPGRLIEYHYAIVQAPSSIIPRSSKSISALTDAGFKVSHSHKNAGERIELSTGN